MHRPFAKHLMPLAAAAVAAVLATSVGAAAATSDGDNGSAQPDTLSEFGACLVSEQRGDIVLLLDQSSSLEETDPGRDRVTAASYLVDRLAALSARSGIEVDVIVSSFAADYDTAGGWTTVSTETAESIGATVDAVARESIPIDTDYWNALEGARTTLAEKAAGDEGRPCQAIAWFTDGRHEIDPRTTSAHAREYGTEKVYAPGVPLTTSAGADDAEEMGADDLCRAAGLADQVRSAGITILGIGLTSGQGANVEDLALMRSITTGSAEGAAPCGEVTSPLGRFFTADDLNGLLLAFDAISSPEQPPEQGVQGICQGEVCTEHARSFVLDASISDVHILAAASLPEVHAVLVPPGGTEPWLIEPAPLGEVTTTGAAGGSGTYSWLSPSAFELDLHAADNEAWAGQWQLVFVDPTGQSEGEQVTVNLHLSSNIVTFWPEVLPGAPRVGEPLEGVQLVMADMKSRDLIDPLSLLGEVQVEAQLVDASGTAFPVLMNGSAGDVAAPVSVDLTDAAPGTATVTVRTVITTADAVLPDGATVPGTTLAPRESSAPVVIEPPLGFPPLAPSVTFGTLDNTTEASAGLSVTGPGCVWLGGIAGPLSGVPELAGEVTVSSDAQDVDNCLEVAEGETTELGLTLATEQAANGALAGTLEVVVAPLEDLDRQMAVEVPFSADMRRPLDVRNVIWAFVLALALGIGVPVGLLYLAKWYTARIPPRQLLVGTTVATLPEGGGRAQLALAEQDLSVVGMPRAGKKDVTVGPYSLRARMGWLPTEPGHVELVGTDVPSVSDATPGRHGTVARLPLAVHQHWVAVLDQPDSPRTVTVAFLVNGATGPAEREKLLDDARDRLPNVVGDLVAEAGPEDGVPSSAGDTPAVASGAVRPGGGSAAAGEEEDLGADNVWGDWR